MMDVDHQAVATREDPADRGRKLGRRLRLDLVSELRTARQDRGLSLEEVGRAVGRSGSEVGRIERLEVPLDIEQAAALAAVLGYDLSIRTYPAGDAIRDRAHSELLARLRRQLHPDLLWSLEVPLPTPGDRRAWDAVIRTSNRVAPTWSLPVEAETRPRDVQALQRRLALKLRDAGMSSILLLLRGSRHNRDLVRLHRADLSVAFPVTGARALDRLRAGLHPGGSALVML
jgi:transcriptional regulator with XRE-family HTH domain